MIRNLENLNNDQKRLAMKEGNFILIYDFMIKNLNLNISEYLIYALIYAYSKEGSCLHATKAHIAKKMNTSVRTVYRVLKSLKEKNLICEVPYNIGFDGYGIGYSINHNTLKKIPGFENFEHIAYEASHREYGPYKNVRLTFNEYIRLGKRIGTARRDEYIKKLGRKLYEFPDNNKINPNHYAIIMNYYKNDEMENKYPSEDE